MAFFLAVLPILLVFFLMVVFHFGAAKAGLLGYLFCVAVSYFFFGANSIILYYAHVKALWLALDVLLIIWSAYLFYLITDEGGAIRLMAENLPRLTASKEIQAMLVGWVFASFLQGVGGFGVPVAVIAPILLSLQFTPMQAVLIPSVGHGWAVTFGSLGSSFRALIATTAEPTEPLGWMAAALLGGSALICGLAVLYLVQGWKAVRTNGWLGVGIGSVMGAVLVLMVVGGVWNLGSFIAATAGIILSLGWIYLRNHHQIRRETIIYLSKSFSAYLILIIVVLFIQFVRPVHTFLNAFVLTGSVPELTTSENLLRLSAYNTPAEKVGNLRIFSHPGVVLFYACCLTFLFFSIRHCFTSGAVSRILGGTLSRLLPTSLSVWSMVTMAVIMELSGMTTVLANSLAMSLSQIYPFVAPWIGAVGAFITGSNTNSNVLFGLLQQHTAFRLNLSSALILAAQTAGASLASVLAPAKIIVGTSTTGLSGKEGFVLKKLLPFVILEVLLISMIVFAAVLFTLR
jgi:lactate permease